MKHILVFFACYLLAVTLVNSEDVRRREKLENECKEELIATKGKNENPDFKCLYECMHKKAGFINDDGTWNIKKLIPPSPSGFMVLAINSTFHMCDQYANGDSCMKSVCLENILANIVSDIYKYGA